MTSEEQVQSTNLPQVNGSEDDDKQNENDNEVMNIISNASSVQPLRRSRFFRSKRKQRNQDEPSTKDESNDIDSKENSGLEQPMSGRPIVKISVADTNTEADDVAEVEEETRTVTGIGTKPSHRVFISPPPSPTLTDDTDETDASTTSEESQFIAQVEDIDAERTFSFTKNTSLTKPANTQSRLCLPTPFSGYERKKSQSVKLTNADQIDAYKKKIVRFADDFGLALSQVKEIKTDELPNVPKTAFKDLHICDDDNPTSLCTERTRIITYLEQQFENPMHAQGFDDRVARHGVALEQANAIDNRIYGTIKIVSFGMNKRVKIRFTTDNWISHHDSDATYITDSYDGTHDRFAFTLTIDRDRICIGNNIQFCIGYETYVGPEHWDSNYQQNYRFDCISRTIPDYSG